MQDLAVIMTCGHTQRAKGLVQMKEECESKIHSSNLYLYGRRSSPTRGLSSTGPGIIVTTPIPPATHQSLFRKNM